MKGIDMDNLTDIIINNEKLIYSIISKYSNYCDIEDLYQVATIGMIKAYNKYNDKFNTKFTTYAYTYMLGEVIKHISTSRQLKLSNEYMMLSKKINDAKSILTQKLMKEPCTYELSLFLEIDEKIIEEVLQATAKVESLDQIIFEDGKKIFLEDIIPSKEENNIDKIMLLSEIDKLEDREQDLIRARYFEDKTQSETASYLGINQVQVFRNEQKILKKLKNEFERVS